MHTLVGISIILLLQLAKRNFASTRLEDSAILRIYPLLSAGCLTVLGFKYRMSLKSAQITTLYV